MSGDARYQLPARLGVGLLQGLAFLLLYQASEHKIWPATDSFAFAPLVAVAIFLPLVLISALGHVRFLTLAVWAVIATPLCVGLGVYDVFRGSAAFAQTGALIVPSETMWFSLAVILFIAQTLIVSGAIDQQVVPSYPTLFDVAWKYGVQLTLAIGFVGSFWAVLVLGIALFGLINIEFPAGLIKPATIGLPITAVAFSYAVHVTDVRTGIVQGARTLALILLSWLLPVMTLMAVAFIIALLFTGLEPLWQTRRATSILLSAVAALVVLINANYQDGRSESRSATILRRVYPIAALVLVPLVAIAAYALILRINQYGWTPERITALASVVVAACFAGGYAVAIATSMRLLERTNMFTALVIVALLLALRTPIADPDRISVADQLHRLETGKVTPALFDVGFLRRSGRYGGRALKTLAAQTEGPQGAVAERARQALENGFTPIAQTPAQRRSRITVISPSGASLPDSFLDQDWSAIKSRWRLWNLPRCLVGDFTCEAIMVDLDDDGKPEILLFDGIGGNGVAFRETGAEVSWSYFGTIANSTCPGVHNAIKQGHFEITAPSLKEIAVNGARLRVAVEGCGSAHKP